MNNNNNNYNNNFNIDTKTHWKRHIYSNQFEKVDQYLNDFLVKYFSNAKAAVEFQRQLPHVILIEVTERDILVISLNLRTR